MRPVQIGRPTLAVVILLAAAGMSALALIAMLDRLQTSQIERDAKAEMAERLVRNRPSRPLAAAKESGGQPGDLLVVAGSETLAAAAVDRLVRGSVLKASATVLSSRASVDRDGDKAMRRIAVEAVVEGGMDALQRLLFKLETGSPMIFVEELSLQPTMVSGDRSARDDGRILNATLALSAYWRASP
jgi:general secretion pathway protein M